MYSSVYLYLVLTLWHLNLHHGQAKEECLPSNDPYLIRPIMEINYHAPLTYKFVLGRTITARCTASRATGNKMIWSVVNSYNTRKNRKKLKYRVHNEVEKITDKKTGLCTSIVVSTMTFKVTKYYNDSFISCFTRRTKDPGYCIGELAFLIPCAGSKYITVLDGPLTRPTLTAIYSKPPNFVYADDVLEITCSVAPGKDGVLQFTIHMLAHGNLVVNSLGSRREIVGKDGLTYKESTIQVHVKKHQEFLNQSYHACFAYNIRGVPRWRLSCSDSDEYCVKSEKIIIIQRKKKDTKWYSLNIMAIFAVCFYLMMVIFCLAAPVRSYSILEFEGEATGDNVW